MGRWTGSWLSGPSAARKAGSAAGSDPVSIGAVDQAEGAWPGSRLGLPVEGEGAVAGFGRRTLAFLIDTVVANLLAGLPYLLGYRYESVDRGYVVLVCFVLENLVLLSIAGQTVGYRLTGMALMSIRGGQVLPLAVLVRTVLLVLLVPALITDRDRRGLHDRAAGSVVVRVGPSSS